MPPWGGRSPCAQDASHATQATTGREAHLIVQSSAAEMLDCDTSNVEEKMGEFNVLNLNEMNLTIRDDPDAKQLGYKWL